MKQSEIKRLLPSVFQRAVRPDNPLSALLEVMETLHQPTEETLGHIEGWFNPYSTPDRFVPFLARWIDLDRFFPALSFAPSRGGAVVPPISTGMGRLRELISAAAHLSQWRGTATGLKRFLEIATGADGFTLEEQVPGPDGLPLPFHIRVRAPQTVLVHRALIERIIEQEKPAYVTYELEFGP